MRGVVWKYEIKPGVTGLEMPYDAQFLAVHEQRDGVFVWMLVNPEQKDVAKRVFLTVATGKETEALQLYPHRGTVFLHGGSLVFHVFEVCL